METAPTSGTDQLSARQGEILSAAESARISSLREADPGALLREAWRETQGLLSYLLESETHTFAFSFAANFILSFIPFLVLLYSIVRHVFRSASMGNVIGDLVEGILPVLQSDQGWAARNLALVAAHQEIRAFSLVMIIIACTGIFLPLEVALNRAWGVVKSRNYLLNQLVAFALVLVMTLLGLGMVGLNAGQRWLLTKLFFGHVDNWFFHALSDSWFVITGTAFQVLLLFTIYWVLPNRKVPVKPVFKTALICGVIGTLARGLYTLVLPHLDFRSLYGPFYISVGLLMWAYVFGLILFSGAQFSAQRQLRKTARESILK